MSPGESTSRMSPCCRLCSSPGCGKLFPCPNCGRWGLLMCSEFPCMHALVWSYWYCCCCC